jgi:hypothetical protein
MPAWIWILVAIVIIAVVAAIVATAAKRRRMQSRFGPEYDRAVAETGSRRRATSELSQREKRRQELSIVPLSTAARERYAERWQMVQARFVDQPKGAVTEADGLVTMVMQERGYPVENFEQRSSDVSVDHPQVVDDYRAAHGISLANQQGKASTEDLRQAMVHYRSLFDELLGQGQPHRTARDRRVS